MSDRLQTFLGFIRRALIAPREAGAPELLADFGRWQDVAWRRDTLALH